MFLYKLVNKPLEEKGVVENCKQIKNTQFLLHFFAEKKVFFGRKWGDHVIWKAKALNSLACF